MPAWLTAKVGASANVVKLVVAALEVLVAEQLLTMLIEYAVLGARPVKFADVAPAGSVCVVVVGVVVTV